VQAQGVLALARRRRMMGALESRRLAGDHVCTTCRPKWQRWVVLPLWQRRHRHSCGRPCRASGPVGGAGQMLQ
jgi:hypothetical protein